MKSILMGWVFRAAFGLIVGAVGISIATEQARADSCSGTTIRHGAADCLTAAFSNNRQTLTLTNECSGLGVVNAEIKVVDLGPDGPIIYLRGLLDSTPFISHLRSDDATYTNARCCTTSGICAITDCDTTDGVIDDTSHASHCRLINDTTGQIITGGQIIAGTEITNGVLVYPTATEGEQ